MNTRKAVLRVGGICLRVAVFILICLGLISLGRTTYRYTHAVFSEEAYEEAPGRTVRLNIPEDVSSKRLAQVMEDNGTYELSTSMPPSEMFKILSSNGDET